MAPSAAPGMANVNLEKFPGNPFEGNIRPAMDGITMATSFPAEILIEIFMLKVLFDKFQVSEAVWIFSPWVIRPHELFFDSPISVSRRKRMISPTLSGITGMKENTIRVGDPAFGGKKLIFVFCKAPTSVEYLN